MPATAVSEAIRVRPGFAGAPPDDDRDAPEPDWRELLRALRATDEDDVPLFGRLPA
jgi:hypothetical protein